VRLDSRFESADREMSSWLVTWKHPDGRRFYLDDEHLMTFEIEEAKRFRYHDEAERAAWGRGPAWTPISVPEARNQ
jgi:hypothetical protein